FLIFCALLFVLSISTAIANGGKKRRVELATLRYQPRLQGLKDWFIRGDIAEAEYERIKTTLEPALKGETPDARAQHVGSLLSNYGLFAILTLVVLVPTDIIMFFEFDDDVFLLAVILLLATAFVVTTSVLAMVRGSQLKNDAAQLANDFEKEITRLEEELLRAGHSRKRGAAPSYPTAGPAFSPYTRR
ncbi:MAG: hypothetical protein HYT80_05670, partial [Euryarchaeota archaeon]|nr:hypothetical protein [Euryarchaeota archaeon]